MAATDQNGGGWRGKTARGLTWGEFDRLPVGLKRMFWNAPYPYGNLGAVEAWREGADMRVEVRRHHAAVAEDVRRESAVLYGEPQEGWV